MRATQTRTPEIAKDTVNLVVAWRRASGYDFGSVATADAVTNDLRTLLDSIKAGLDQKTEVAWSIDGDLNADEYMVAPYDVPTIHETDQESAHATRGRRAVAARTDSPKDFRTRLVSIDAMPDVGAADLLHEQVVFYAIVRGVDITDREAYIRRLNPMQVAKKGRWVLEFGDTLTRLESPIFVMDDQIDLIMRPDDVVVLDAKLFVNLFFELSGFDAEMGEIITKTLARLKASDETIKMLADMARDRLRFRGKIQKIKKSGHLGAYTMADFEAALRRRHLPKADFMHGGRIHASTENAEVLLAVLNQDLFEGCLDGKRKIAGSKRDG